MTLGVHKKDEANEICRRLDGLGFSCKAILLKRRMFKLQRGKYIIKTDAPEIIAKDVVQGVYY